MRRLTHQEFVTRVKKRYPELRVNSLYRNTRSPVCMKCTKKDSVGDTHGEFVVRDTGAFLHGKNNRNGCKKCANDSRSIAKTQHHYNYAYFDVLTMENCYWAGFIAADGCIINKNHIVIKLSSKDKIHLQVLAETVLFTGVLYEHNYTSNFGRFPSTSLYFSNGLQWITALQNNFNIGTRKSLTYTHPNNLTDEQSLAFIKGYIDGDGHISFRPRVRIGAAGTLETLTWIKQHFDRISPARSLNGMIAKPRKMKGCNVHYYEIGHKRAKRIIGILSNLDTPELERKWSMD